MFLMYSQYSAFISHLCYQYSKAVIFMLIGLLEVFNFCLFKLVSLSLCGRYCFEFYVLRNLSLFQIYENALLYYLWKPFGSPMLFTAYIEFFFFFISYEYLIISESFVEKTILHITFCRTIFDINQIYWTMSVMCVYM